MIHLCIATPDLTEQIHTREKMIHLCIATPDLTEQIHTREKMIHLCIATPDMTEEHPSTTPERSAYLCVSFHCSHGAIAGQCQRLVDRPGGHSTWGGKQTDGARSH